MREKPEKMFPQKLSPLPGLLPLAGTPEEEGQKARHFLGLVEMHASVTRNITNQQKVLMAISNLKGAAFK
jgi:hypothetical protein